jgi:hypothetical protein
MPVSVKCSLSGCGSASHPSDLNKLACLVVVRLGEGTDSNYGGGSGHPWCLPGPCQVHLRQGARRLRVRANLQSVRDAEISLPAAAARRGAPPDNGMAALNRLAWGADRLRRLMRLAQRQDSAGAHPSGCPQGWRGHKRAVLLASRSRAADAATSGTKHSPICGPPVTR